jgi:hypothetical protein
VNKEQLELLEKIRKAEIQQSERWISYWFDYSHLHTWQFWIVLAMFIVPLIVLLLFIDRRKIFHLGFYGYGVHVFMVITDSIGVTRGWWTYPYKILPGIPSNVAQDSSFVPVVYILLYQYTLNRNKNYYLWLLLLSLVFAFFIKPLLLGIGLFRFGGKENFFLLFIFYIIVGLIAKWLTDLFTFLSISNKWSLFHKKSNS